ncbi:hypothetical protein LINGRAHAP2_LOCUS2089 [Linum grandiflorum]
MPRTIVGFHTFWRVINSQCGSWNAALRKANTTPTSKSNLSDVVSNVLVTFIPRVFNMLNSNFVLINIFNKITYIGSTSKSH